MGLFQTGFNQNTLKARWIFLLAFSFVWKPSYCQKLEWTSNCAKAYQYFLSFRIQDARNELAKEFASNPKNIMPYALVNYEDFITLSFNENPEQYKLKKSAFHGRLKVLDAADKQSPYYLFLKGLLYFQWSIVQAKHKDFTDAALNFRKSYLQFRANQKAFPTFMPNKVFIGMEESLISSIPSGYKWIASLLGLKGSLLEGMNYLQAYIQTDQAAFREEAMLYQIYLTNYLENDPKLAYNLIAQYKLDTKNNTLFAFVASNLALNNKNAALAEQILNNRVVTPGTFSFPMLDYELADAKMKRLDFNAKIYFQKFLNQYKGYFYIKDAYYQLALIAYLQGDMNLTNTYLSKTIREGYAETDADKQALRNAKRNYLPNKNLLKARLLNDGGYNQEALTILNTLSATEMKSEAEKLEYTYRLARVYDDLQQDDKALKYYEQTFRAGEESTEYYAARSALQMAFIYEKRKQFNLAIDYYNKLLNLGEHDYKNSLDQRAKSGLARLRKE